MADQTLLPDSTSLHLLHIETERSVITMVVRTTASEAKCSLCEKISTKVHEGAAGYPYLSSRGKAAQRGSS